MRNIKYFQSDYLVIGGGIVGGTICRRLGLKYPQCKVSLLEKESKLGRHNSTLNSGVLHFGLYYPTNSNRAKYCVRGNKLLNEYHKEKKILMKKCGKFIVATNKEETDRIVSFYERGLKNGVRLELINKHKALEIEPHLKISGDFPVLFSPDTSVGNPGRVIEEIENDLRSLSNVQMNMNCGFKEPIKISSSEIHLKDTNDNIHITKKLINAAGLYSDKISKQFGIGLDFELIPLIGTYLVDLGEKENTSANKLKTLVYPLPPAKKGNNFLGVHTTITVDGCVKLGPTALPCFWREQHRGLSSFNFSELSEIFKTYSKLVLSENRNYYFDLLISQLKYQIPSNIVEDSKKLVTIYDSLPKNKLGMNILGSRFKSKTGGVRSQLINTKTYEMENDFIFMKDEINKNNIHILNMISPGWTSAFAIAEDDELFE